MLERTRHVELVTESLAAAGGVPSVSLCRPDTPPSLGSRGKSWGVCGSDFHAYHRGALGKLLYLLEPQFPHL